jgi:signal transduction histidine kinase
VDNKIENPKINISIKADKTANKVSLSIEDNGGGVPTEIIDRIFEPYFTTKEQGKGTGIGLYMAKEIIERQMGGRIYCENTDSGARFVVEMQKTF